MNTKKSFNRIVAHVIATLPDSIKERKIILGDVLQLLDKSHPLRLQVDEMNRWLEAHEQHQMELSLDFKSENPLTRLAKPNKAKSK